MELMMRRMAVRMRRRRRVVDSVATTTIRMVMRDRVGGDGVGVGVGSDDKRRIDSATSIVLVIGQEFYGNLIDHCPFLNHPCSHP